MKFINPFAYREIRAGRELLVYRVLAVASWALAVAVSIYAMVPATETRESAGKGHGHHDHGSSSGRLARQNQLHPTGFTLNMAIVYMYWALLFLAQLAFLGFLFSAELVWALATLVVYFVTHNLLHALFVLLLVLGGHFLWAELVLALDFACLMTVYVLRPMAHYYRDHPVHSDPADPANDKVRLVRLVRLMAIAAVTAGPLAWILVALFWNGAMAAVPPTDVQALALRILANVFVWTLLGFGLFFVVVLGDVAMGLFLSVLLAALGVGQLLLARTSPSPSPQPPSHPPPSNPDHPTWFFTLQYIFAFVILSALFLATMAVAALQLASFYEYSIVTVWGEPEAAPREQQEEDGQDGHENEHGNEHGEQSPLLGS